MPAPLTIKVSIAASSAYKGSKCQSTASDVKVSCASVMSKKYSTSAHTADSNHSNTPLTNISSSSSNLIKRNKKSFLSLQKYSNAWCRVALLKEDITKWIYIAEENIGIKISTKSYLKKNVRTPGRREP